ncbi:LuxR C-terminal-related transcriptional regulator [Gordonibacter massiliensis (ex Traore et al. 2017)]|uniref:LuxR C-terminal-related transcriptional regulator n=1 Tax=Gordonibacter massiliensis (ex Traore et al. 2017) TaxID=1841863 RepID=UPI001C8BF7C2|nr:LuxR C-terminal-related transcriptional regulator [Gordonibacter massiliensis (ex Traore et al. 2017)]MBX9035156.1 hypothetical protein [Gordonibacter massiliensis (ex Traore et al. 2017)]
MNAEGKGGSATTIVGDIQKREEGLLSFLGGFVSLSLMILAVFLLLFDSSLSDGRFALLGVEVPYLVVLALSAFASLLVLKWKCTFFMSSCGKTIIVVASVVGTCVCPLLFGIGATWALPLVAVGIVCTSFRWCLRMCEFSHILLVSLISMAFVCAIIATGLFSMMKLSNLEATAVSSSLAVLSWVLLRTNKTSIHEELMSVSGAESRKRAMTASADRWTYTTIGLDFGFALGLVCTQRHDLMEYGALGTLAPAALFVVPVALAGFVLLAFHEKRDYALERYSKDHLALTVALGALPLFPMPTVGKYACLMFLMLVASVQIIIVINASVEFIRFEELNPAWYMGEEAFVGGGVTAGLVCAFVGVSNGLDSPLLLAACILVVLFNVFAQTFMNKGAYPTSDLFDRILCIEDETRPAEDREPLAAADEKPSDEGRPDRQSGPVGEPGGRGGAWRFKVAYVCKKYDLSPRQTEIFELLAKGRDAKFIEETFCISKATTKTHIYNIYCRLDIHSKQELIDMVESVSPDEIRSAGAPPRSRATLLDQAPKTDGGNNARGVGDPARARSADAIGEAQVADVETATERLRYR